MRLFVCLLTVGLATNAELPTLSALMRKYDTDKGYHHGYDRIYEPLFEPLRHQPIRLLEIGVDSGKSMELWKEYFPNANLIAGIGYGASFQTTSCAGKVRCFRGDQGNVTFLDEVLSLTGGKFDIIMDDGSHYPYHQFVSFKRLMQRDAILENGLYIVEDIETSYWRPGSSIYGYQLRGSGVGGPCSFVERTKTFIDVINREFVGFDYHATSNRVDHRILSMQYSQNLVVFRVATLADLVHMSRAYRFASQVESPRVTPRLDWSGCDKHDNVHDGVRGTNARFGLSKNFI